MSNDEYMFPAKIIGPVSLHSYDHLRLVKDHQAFLPDGSVIMLPVGTFLIAEFGGGIQQENGFATKNEDIDPRDGNA